MSSPVTSDQVLKAIEAALSFMQDVIESNEGIRECAKFELLYNQGLFAEGLPEGSRVKWTNLRYAILEHAFATPEEETAVQLVLTRLKTYEANARRSNCPICGAVQPFLKPCHFIP